MRALRRARATGLPRSLHKSLDLIERVIGSGDRRAAARRLDQAWRISPDSPALTVAYAHLVALEGREPAAALRLLARVAPDADHVALRVHLLSQLSRDDEARADLAAALNAYCIDSDGWLARTARAQLRRAAAPAWVGRDRGLDFIGEFVTDPVAALQITLDSGAAFMQPLQWLPGGAQRFRFTLPPLPPSARVALACRGVPLMGSGGTALPEFGLEGAVQATRSRIRGWVRLAWSPHAPLALKLTDDRGACVATVARCGARSGHGLGIDVRVAAGKFHGRELTVSAQLPNGEWTSLPDMPTPFEDAVRPAVRGRMPTHWRGDPPARSAARALRRPVEVIIPVYRGHDATLAGIAAVTATAPAARCVVVDDATPEPALAAALDALAAAGRIHLLRNAVNLGFVGAVNRAMALQPSHDVVLLNADTVVFGDWLARLADAAYDAPHVGTATPFSNSGFIASYPGPGEGAIGADEALAVAAHVAALPAVHAALPFGVGFCLYLRRECLADVGPFAADVFGKGYGEETDFCLRARARGWAHRLAAGAFVQHLGGVSFGARREALRERTLRLLERRHPGFQRLLQNYAKRDVLRPLRRRLDHARLLAPGRRYVLLVSLALPGGVERFVAERSRALREQGRVALVLRPQSVGNARACVLVVDGLDTPNLHYAIPAELPALEALLRSLSLEAIEIQHFLHFDPRVIEMVRGLGPYDVVVHDYAWICPRITLIDESGRYCGEPAATVCTTCVRRNGSNLKERISVSALRRRSVRWLTGAAHVRAPSADAARRLARYVERRIEVAPHSALPAPRAPPPERRAARSLPAARTVVRVALLGALGEHKGYQVLLDCARDAAARALPLEFVVIGFTEDDAALTATGKVFITGRFVDGEARALLEREAPDVVFIASVWPETWSYALTDALESGLAVVAFDLGAPAERLRAAGQGVLLPMDATVQRINDEFVQRSAHSALEPARDMDIMGEHREKKTMSKAAAPAPQVDALSASVQILPLTAGLYLFSVTTAGGAPARSGGQLQVPAMHVGLGPGVNSSQVEFVAGPSTEGAWLFALEDCLVTKVHGAGATLVLTSVRGPGGEALSIKVQRLDTLALAGNAAANAATNLPAAPPAARGRNGHAPSAGPANAAAPAVRDDSLPLPVAIGAHIRTRGDMLFSDVPWAGRIAPGLWIESFLVRPLERFQPADIEYKGLTGSGFETPWLTDGIMCGTKGMAVPLVGFAIRLKASRDAAAYDCEYSGYFKSGVTVGPLKNGTPCRSTVANDPLEGIQVQLKKRRDEPALRPKAKGLVVKTPPIAGPSFGRYRDGNAPPAGLPPRAADTRVKPSPPRTAARKRPAKR